MHDAHYLLPGELAAIVAFLFAPPLLLAYVGQTVLFAMRGAFAHGRVSRAMAAYVATTLGSLAVGAVLHQLAPSWLGPVLRVRDVPFAGGYWPVMPLAFVAVAVATVAATRWGLGRACTEA